MKSRSTTLDPKAFLSKVAKGRSITRYGKNQIVFSQGEAADAVFYVQKGKLKVTVVSTRGKKRLPQSSEPTISLVKLPLLARQYA